jgi:hypothetical protein
MRRTLAVFWRLRLHLVCTPSGLPIMWSLATSEEDERHVLTAALEFSRTRVASILIAVPRRQEDVLSSIHDPSTWEPLVRLLLNRRQRRRVAT